MKILVVFGTRPEAIKLAPIVKLAEEYPEMDCTVCITGQHREMLDQVMESFNILPEHDLNVMTMNQNLFQVTVSVLNGLKEVLEIEKPDLVLVQGDTTTAFAAGLAGFYFKTPIAHVEAGLRTYEKYSPYPEEKNRHLLSVIADYHFAPTNWAKSNLVREGICEENIWVTGNTVVDALLTIVSNQVSESMQKTLEAYFLNKWNISLNSKSDVNASKLILVTGHRRENFGEGFKNICYALKEIAEIRDDVTIVYPVHLNPNVQNPVKKILGSQPNIFLIEPLKYEHLIFLMSRSYLILTDSGGIQEEAPSLGKPLLILRNTSERPEGIDAGTAKLVGTNVTTIISEIMELLNNSAAYDKMSKVNNPYGDGNAARRIVTILLEQI